MAVDVPQLELYHDLAGQLSAWVEESKRICGQAEEDVLKVTPALFREFSEADELEKQDLLVYSIPFSCISYYGSQPL